MLTNQDWLITDAGEAINCTNTIQEDFVEQSYRLYRFLTDLEDILTNVEGDRDRLKAIRPFVRKLLNNNPWLLTEYEAPDPELGWSVTILYDEPDFPLTVQTVAWSPGQVSPIHNHGTWGLVALISGQEKNTFWQETDPSNFTSNIKQVGELTLNPGDIIGFLPNTIHHVKALGDEATISFNLYGETDYEQRFEFDLVNSTKTNF
jgi:predicted metal-dependent enzyme (double-stranded beta helix superfamily)